MPARGGGEPGRRPGERPCALAGHGHVILDTPLGVKYLDPPLAPDPIIAAAPSGHAGHGRASIRSRSGTSFRRHPCGRVRKSGRRIGRVRRSTGAAASSFAPVLFACMRPKRFYEKPSAAGKNGA